VGDRSRILEEQTRLRSLNNLLNRAGFQPIIYEDYVDVTLDLLGELGQLVSSPSVAPSTVASTLLERFNSDEISSAVIAYLRV
jgi:ubiquitin thioesterase protein OTUB1